MKPQDEILCKDGVYYYQKGWKQKIGGMTKIYVTGNDYERGIQFGTLLSEEITTAIESYLWFITKTSGKIPFKFKWFSRWMLSLAKPLLFLFYRKRIEKQMAKYPAWIIDELEGMAKGAQINPFYLKFMNAGGGGDEPAHSCCSFAFNGKDGDLYHGKNLDWVPIEAFIDLICFQQHEDENGDSFFIIGVPGIFKYYEFGMNSHGISIGLTGRFFRGKRAAKIVSTSVIETKLLRYGKNLKEIKQIYNTKSGFDKTDCLLISSKTDKDFRLFEVTPIGVAATSPDNSVLFNTNTYVHPVFRKCNKQWGTIYNNDFCDPRYKRLNALTAQKPETLDDAFKILRDTVQPGFEHKTFLGQASINRFVTHVSALMIQGKNPGVWIARDRTYAASNEYVFFDLSPQPQQTEKKKAAEKIIYTEKFKNFKDFMHLREKRYYISPGKLRREAGKLLAKEPGNPVFILFLAQNYFKYGKFSQAISILESHPSEWTADHWYCLGKNKQQLKQYDAAKECFVKAMKLPPIDGFPELVKTVCLVGLVKLSQQLGQAGEARRWKERLQSMKDKFATPYIGMPDYPYVNNIVEQLEQVML